MSTLEERQRRAIERVPPPLPNLATMESQRSIQMRTTLNDRVEAIYLKLYTDPVFQEYLDAVYDEQAVEGSLAADNIKAAEMIRDYARDQNRDVKLGSQKLATISKSLGVVLRRYVISRRERRDMIHGENVPGGNGE